MLKRCVALAAVVMCLSSMPLFAAKADVEIVNKSKWDIHHFFLSPVEDEKWGPDQLGDEILAAKGGSFTLTGIPCDEYDVKLIDEDGDECILGAVPICGEDESWLITNDDLLACQFGS